jgi:hypothetical protein
MDARADDVDPYRTHSRWSDPGHLASRLVEVSPVADTVARVVSGLVLDPFLAGMRGVEMPPGALEDRDARSVKVILARLLSRDGRALAIARTPETRFLGCCRQYALLATSVFRAHGVPARARVGFAAYFTPGFLEDHWVCEYWDGERWRLLDANLDEAAVADFGVTFAPWDVPRDAFVDASSAWRRVRAGALDPARMGLSAYGLAGAWFVANNVLRDAAALNKDEMLPWDFWSVAREFVGTRDVSPAWTQALDTVAGLLQGTPGAGLAQRVYREHAWLEVTPSVLSLGANGEANEVDVRSSP